MVVQMVYILYMFSFQTFIIHSQYQIVLFLTATQGRYLYSIHCVTKGCHLKFRVYQTGWHYFKKMSGLSRTTSQTF